MTPEGEAGVAQIAVPLYVMAVLAGWVCVKAGFVGMALWFHAACPVAAERMLATYQLRSRRCTLVGVVNAILGLFLVMLLIASQVFALLGILLFLFLGVLSILGYAVAFRDLGLRLGIEGSKPRVVLLGGLVAEASFFVPIIGQLFSLWVFFRGLGAVVLTLLARRRSDVPEAELDQPSVPSEP